MSKQVLSVADFAIILRLIDDRMSSIEEMYCHQLAYKDGFYLKPALVSDKSVQKELLHNNFYQDLVCLKNSLQKLNIEIETPDVEIAHEDKGE